MGCKDISAASLGERHNSIKFSTPNLSVFGKYLPLSHEPYIDTVFHTTNTIYIYRLLLLRENNVNKREQSINKFLNNKKEKNVKVKKGKQGL